MTILIVGGGKMGMSHLALATQYVGKSNVALCDTKFSTRTLFRFLGYQTFKTMDEAFRVSRLDGVVIATPTPSHAMLARWAIERKVPLFIEKPLTLDAETSEDIVAMADLAGVSAQVGFVLRYVASFQRLRSLVAAGSLGRLRHYDASMRGNVISKALSSKSWQGDFARGGGCLNEYGPHIIDLCQFIFGPVVNILKAKMVRKYSSNADDSVDIDWEHQDSTLGSIKVDWSDSTKRKSVIEFKVMFDYADVRVDNSAIEIRWHDDAPLDLGARNSLSAPVQPRNVGFYLRGEEFSLELEDFLSACFGKSFRTEKSIPDNISPHLKDGYEVDSIIDKIARKACLK
ncbi:Gfo/Idh/MocA family protein [Polynucleobacter sphagniphilus]|uniref:Gfo/Idh/MocA family protein n=1 Tax=Polynucleobacter sphagniphilus TaxID=1743169 RepID=UPI0024760228|nr:Gfo/Idh/MocA family oxidoreductase [Polynucleobacter sphagniphilus]MDH6525584.1 putative dehydrogenase [Polynucleobacter sphagniphilus]